jgi:hypothetical protein
MDWRRLLCVQLFSDRCYPCLSVANSGQYHHAVAGGLHRHDGPGCDTTHPLPRGGTDFNPWLKS